MRILSHVEKVKLTGSPSMVTWARRLRTKRAQIIEKEGVRVMLVALKPLITEEIFNAMRITTPKHASSLAHGVALQMLANSDARWWIENRDAPPYHNIKDAAAVCFAHYVKTKPFK